MTSAQLRRLTEEWRGWLGLGVWEIEVTTVRAGPEAPYASMDANTHWLTAEIEYNLSRVDEDNAAATVVHELLHLTFWPLQEMLRQALQAGGFSNEFTEQVVEDEIEKAITTLERAFTSL